MCGIAGVFSSKGDPSNVGEDLLRRMGMAIAHRGPDDHGAWSDASAGIGLSHRRLSILDLSALGHQPMVSPSGRYVMVFNGEIYNFQSLRDALLERGFAFRGTSDTEVLLAAIEHWGIRETLVRATGMLAFAVWDRQDRALTLARDRFGEKPLYYGRFGDTVLFGSELKALRAHPAWHADIDRDALTLLLRFGYIPAPHSIFRQVRKVCAGAYMTLRFDGSQLQVAEEIYFSPRQEMQNAHRSELTDSPEKIVDRLETTLTDAVRQQMVADVPIGAFLSGGVDSSLVVATMQKISSRPVRTFSIGFAEKEFNEAPFAKAVADHLGTSHTELLVTSGDALDVIPLLPRLYDEPMADQSQIPTFLVSKLARTQVTVSLSGDAGDELFGGYSRYALARERWEKLSRVPRAIRHAAGGLLGAAPRWSLGALSAALKFKPSLRRRPDLVDRLQSIDSEIRAADLGEFYWHMNSYFRHPGRIAKHSNEPRTVADSRGDWLGFDDDLRHMMYVDTCLYMADDILTKVDRAAMAVSLETRVPLLDPAVAGLAWRIPTSVHFHDGKGKWPLRQLLERYVPRVLIDRPKMGFGVPIGHWLRSDLRDWAEALLDPARLRREGFFDADEVTRLWNQHQGSTAVDWSYHLWIILSFQAWHEEWTKAPA